jgi:glutamate-5-semialdehyde dehydrogenase
MNLTSVFKRVLKASRTLSMLDHEAVVRALLLLAEETEKNSGLIISENKKDLDRMNRNDPKYDRLLLSSERIKGIISDLRKVAHLSNPLGKILSEYSRPDGLKISKISVPFGVIGVIYESRPNVTFDVFSLCLKSGNACILKGGSDAINSNTAIVSIIKGVLATAGIDPEVVTLLPAGRSETSQLLKAAGYVDLLVRGAANL